MAPLGRTDQPPGRPSAPGTEQACDSRSGPGHGPGGTSLSGVMAPLDVDVGNMASKTSSFKAVERPDALKQASGRSCQFARIEAVLANRRSLAYQVTYADCSYLLKRRMRNVRRFLGVPPLGV